MSDISIFVPEYDSSSNDDDTNSSEEYHPAIDLPSFGGHAIKYGNDDGNDESDTKSNYFNKDRLKSYGKNVIIFSYIVILNMVAPFLIYYYLLDDKSLAIPYWIGYGALLLTNFFKLTEGILATIAYFHRKMTKEQRLMLDTDTDRFVKVYDTDFTHSKSNERMVLVDGLPVKDYDPPLQDEHKEYMAKISYDIPNLLVLIPAYLINEQEIIFDTLNHMGTVIYSGQTEILLVFNSPHFEGKEEVIDRLNELSGQFEYLYGKKLYIAENLTSHSKAENVNYGLQLIRDGKIFQPDIVAMYDADHQPELWAWERAVYMFFKTSCHVIQGRCVIRNNENFFARMVAVEYELMYTLHQKGGQFIRNYGIFGGSNGFWLYEVLNDIEMDQTMLTEDIDSNFRALEKDNKVIYCDDVISYELTPPNFSSWVSQRLRWSQGWFEVMFRHTWRMLKCKNLTWQQRLATLIYLPYRELSIYLMAQIAPCAAAYFLKYGTDGIIWELILVSIIVKDVPVWINTLMVGATISTDSHRWYNTAYKPIPFICYIQFIMFSPFYLQALLIISMISHCRHFMAMHQWVVTPR